MRSFLSRLSIGACLLTFAACGAPTPGVARGEAVFDTCAPCHGDAGQGKPELEAPPLAGAAEWYLTTQLNNYQAGMRGYHYQDAAGLRMKPMSRSLTPEDLQSVVAYILTLPAANPAPTGLGDAQAGAQEYAVCSACHGIDGSGNQALNSPSLLHLPDWYIVNSVKKIRDRVRGGAPGDVAGATMFPMVMNLSDESIENVAAYIQTLGGDGAPPPATPVTTPAGDQPAMDIDPALLPDGVTEAMVQEGQTVFAGSGICYTCHMAEGAGGPLAPNLTDEVWLNIDGSYDAIVGIINSGVPQPREHPGAMLPRAGMPLTDDQVAAVAAYVYMLSR